MMTLEDRIEAFVKLGKKINELDREEFEILSSNIQNNNTWFTPVQTEDALRTISINLQKENFESWLSSYDLKAVKKIKSIGVLMAGNVPAVGFHDLLCVLISGHKACIKLSSSDQVLMNWLVKELIALEPRFDPLISVEEMLKSKDAYIATGSDNSARYFEYYFGRYPHIIRKNRTSVGILDGIEKPNDFRDLGKDVFQYYGLGCRNVSKLYVRNNDTLIEFLDAIAEFRDVAHNHKYHNNYEYNKSIFLVNKDPHLDNGFLLMKESNALVSPIAVLYYELYADLEELNLRLSEEKEKIQCIVSLKSWYPGSLDFGTAQCPGLDDYADGVDTLQFLQNLS
ncbi:acyl-CoA reductase [Aquiflexum lacus]|uniref:acyl-CoA reductase n=1 Tax=Aquiflexum lacus TaxID=2483805 RepID=UPI00293BF4A2|nr:acyl-CoA reductase [Aquiflexum lacus]